MPDKKGKEQVNKLGDMIKLGMPYVIKHHGRDIISLSILQFGIHTHISSKKHH